MERRIKGVLSPKASGSITITKNGNYDVVDVANAVVEVKPSGTIEITENGEHDVANYEKANVNVVDENGEASRDVLQSIVDSSVAATSSTYKRPFLEKSFTTFPTNLDLSQVNINQFFARSYKIETFPPLNTKNNSDFSYWFAYSENLKEIKEVDFSNGTNATSMCSQCYKLEKVTLKNVNKLININSMFYACYTLKEVNGLDVDIIVDAQSCFSNNTEIETIIFDKIKPTNASNMFGQCSNLKTCTLNLIECSSSSNIFFQCKKLTNLKLYNVKVDIQIASGTTYGHLITKESLIQIIGELIDTGSSKKLTIGSANLSKLANVYVRIISTEPDENGNVKLPFEVCSANDDGAMLITNYVTQKNWSLA